METKRDFYKMIADNRRKLKNNTSNCIGTSLYLVGEIKEDKHLYGNHNKILEKLKESNTPKLGYLVGWENNFKNIYHLAVVVNENPLTLTTRNGINKPVLKNQLFKETDSIYKDSLEYSNKKNKFFIPSKLQKIVNNEDIKDKSLKLKLIQKIKIYIKSWKKLDFLVEY